MVLGKSPVFVPSCQILRKYGCLEVKSRRSCSSRRGCDPNPTLKPPIEGVRNRVKSPLYFLCFLWQVKENSRLFSVLKQAVAHSTRHSLDSRLPSNGMTKCSSLQIPHTYSLRFLRQSLARRTDSIPVPILSPATLLISNSPLVLIGDVCGCNCLHLGNLDGDLAQEEGGGDINI
jgi:hypothetical protein